MRTLITDGTVVNADGSTRADVLIEGESIAAVGRGLGAAAGQVDRTIEATGKYIIPGAIDVHTHMEMPFGGTFS
jgi:dihydropyrimidinase